MKGSVLVDRPALVYAFCIAVRIVGGVREDLFFGAHHMWRNLVVVLLYEAISGAIFAGALLWLLRNLQPVKTPPKM